MNLDFVTSSRTICFYIATLQLSSFNSYKILISHLFHIRLRFFFPYNTQNHHIKIHNIYIDLEIYTFNGRDNLYNDQKLLVAVEDFCIYIYIYIYIHRKRERERERERERRLSLIYIRKWEGVSLKYFYDIHPL